MSTFSRLTQVFNSSEEIPFNDFSKIVLISDCHRGNGSWADNFRHNQYIYYFALNHYYKKGFTYIELGDTDELWKHKKYSDISGIYTDIFKILHRLYNEDRFYMIFGNHDIVKRKDSFRKKHLSRYYNDRTGKTEPLFEDIKAHEGLILKHTETGEKIFLVHGHQGDIMNDKLWWWSRFKVRHIGKFFDIFAIKDPTSTAKNYKKKEKVERRISDWVRKNNQMTVVGHTHRPMFPRQDEIKYINSGCCVYPNGITCIEIMGGKISLVEWEVKTRDDGSLYVSRNLMSNPININQHANRPADKVISGR